MILKRFWKYCFALRKLLNCLSIKSSDCFIWNRSMIESSLSIIVKVFSEVCSRSSLVISDNFIVSPCFENKIVLMGDERFVFEKGVT